MSLAFCALALIAPSGGAQEPVPARLSFSQLEAGRGAPIALTYAWRFHPGDDRRWSVRAVDDRAWEIVDPQMPEGARPRGGWPGVGWFRRHILVADPNPSRRVLLTIDAPGRASVYLDGTPVVDGAVDMSPGAHVLAVRYECDCAAARGAIGYRLALDLPEAAEARAATARREGVILGKERSRQAF